MTTTSERGQVGMVGWVRSMNLSPIVFFLSVFFSDRCHHTQLSMPLILDHLSQASSSLLRLYMLILVHLLYCSHFIALLNSLGSYELRYC